MVHIWITVWVIHERRHFSIYETGHFLTLNHIWPIHELLYDSYMVHTWKSTRFHIWNGTFPYTKPYMRHTWITVWFIYWITYGPYTNYCMIHTWFMHERWHFYIYEMGHFLTFPYINHKCLIPELLHDSYIKSHKAHTRITVWFIHGSCMKGDTFTYMKCMI
jgi:hypothetical protein